LQSYAPWWVPTRRWICKSPLSVMYVPSSHLCEIDRGGDQCSAQQYANGIDAGRYEINVMALARVPDPQDLQYTGDASLWSPAEQNHETDPRVTRNASSAASKALTDGGLVIGKVATRTN